MLMGASGQPILRFFTNNVAFYDGSTTLVVSRNQVQMHRGTHCRATTFTDNSMCARHASVAT